jgi:hypothetical protein
VGGQECSDGRAGGRETVVRWRLAGEGGCENAAVEEGNSRSTGGRGTAVQRRDGVLSWVHARVGNWRIQIKNERKREKGIKKATLPNIVVACITWCPLPFVTY